MNTRWKIGFLIAVLAVGAATTAAAGKVDPGRTNVGPGPPPPPPPNIPPPPPPPPPPPAPTDYVLYFGFDQAVISPDAQDILGKAAKDVAVIVRLNSDYRAQLSAYCERRATTGPCQSAQAKDAYRPTAVIVAYADTSGSAAYNLRLSERRAKAAADALVGLGVAPASIDRRWKGETDPAVNTGDGVQEPLNRRLTIHVGAAGS